MKTTKYPCRLPQIRLDEETYQKVVQCAKANDLSIAEVQRAAIQEYVEPAEPHDIPIVGVLKDGKIIVYKQDKEEEVPKIPRARYMDAEILVQSPPSAPSITEKA